MCITGVSGSGKSSLINEILYKRLVTELNGAKKVAGAHTDILGIDNLDKVIAIDQSPIGRTPRSNPATYTGVFNDIRDLFASTAEAKARGYKANRFSFNVKGGRCEACQGDGIVKIEMHFLADIYVPCDVCKGARYNRETLEVKYKGKNIYDVLEMTVEEGLEFFSSIPKIKRKLQPSTMSVSAMSKSVSPQRRFPAARRSASSFQLSFHAALQERLFIFLMSLPRVCTRPMYTSSSKCYTGLLTTEIQSLLSNTTSMS